MHQTQAAATISQTAARPCIDSAILDRVANCIQHGCVVCIEHADAVQPHLSRWRLWGKPSCFNGDLDAIYSSIDSCRSAHADHHIRLNVESMTWRSRLSMVVHRPH